MNTALSRFAAGTGLAACLATSIGCYPAYPPPNANGNAYSQDAKGYEVPYEQAPVPQEAPPARYGVDPGVVVAGAVAWIETVAEAPAASGPIGHRRPEPSTTHVVPGVVIFDSPAAGDSSRSAA